MKTSIIRLFSLLLTAIPLMAAAQTNIKTAFDAIINCPEAQVIENHTLDKDPQTGLKTGQCDIYSFTLPSNKMKLVKNVLSAFDKDADMAYSMSKGKAISSQNKTTLAVGNDSGSGVLITPIGHDYIYSLFLAPLSEDPDGIYRYAYAINYIEEKNKITGQLVITYATTLKHRQQIEQQRQYNLINNLPNGAYVLTNGNTVQKSWFELLISYFQGMTSASTQTRISLATKAYRVIKDTSKYPESLKPTKKRYAKS